MHTKELEWIHKLQEWIRSPLMDQFFIGWDYIDTYGFSFLLVATTWYLINRRIGIKLLYILTLNAVVNRALKELFDLPRPCHIDPSVGVLCFPWPGFPSGAAQTAMLLAGITFIECRSWLYRNCALVFALFLCFSRIYLGVHFFADILGGLFVGSLLLLVYWKLFPLFEKRWKLMLFLFPPLLLLIGQTEALQFFCLTFGVALGLLLDQKAKKMPQKIWVRLAQALVVVFGAFMFEKAKVELPDLSLFFSAVSGLWFSFLGAFFVKYLLPKKDL